MKILKFGGTSLSTPERVKQVSEIISQFHSTGEEIAIVLSAFGGVTDELVRISHLASKGEEEYRERLTQLTSRHIKVVQELIPPKEQSRVLTQVKIWMNELEDALQGVFLVWELSNRTLDFIMSFGELLSSYIFSEFLKANENKAEFLDARTILRADESFGAAKLDFDLSNSLVREYFENHKALQVITGFIASTPSGETITLGRGGSDYTASIIGAALDVNEILIFTDVDGVMTADPAKVLKAYPIANLTYEEAMELSHFGAKVIYPPTMQPALSKKIPLRICNTFNPTFKGSLITEKKVATEQKITAVTSISRIALVRVQGSGMVGVAGTASRIFSVLAKNNINVILITQASSEHTICLAVEPDAADKTESLLNSEFSLEIIAKQLDPVIIDRNLSIVSIVGENMKRPGISGRLFHALGRNGVNITAIAQGSSELNISSVIPREDESKALNAIHDEFFLSGSRSLNIFLAGPGLIGKTLLTQIAKQKQFLKDNLALELKLIAVSNSSTIWSDRNGLDLNSINTLFESKGTNGGIAALVRTLLHLNLPNSVLVDCTASEDVIGYYPQILESNVSIVTPNKKKYLF